MKIKRTYRLRAIALFLTALTLVGSIGVNADFHICQNEVKDIAILDLADGCSEMETMLVCNVSATDATTVEKGKCCTNEHVFAKASFENVQVMDNIHLESVSIPCFTSDVAQEVSLVSFIISSEMPPTWQVSSGLHIAFQQFLI